MSSQCLRASCEATRIKPQSILAAADAMGIALNVMADWRYRADSLAEQWLTWIG